MNQKSPEMFPALLTTDSECGLFIAVNQGLESELWEEMDANGLHAIHILSVSAINTALLCACRKKKSALPGNRTQVARMGILHDTTTLAVLT